MQAKSIELEQLSADFDDLRTDALAAAAKINEYTKIMNSLSKQLEEMHGKHAEVRW